MMDTNMSTISDEAGINFFFFKLVFIPINSLSLFVYAQGEY